MTSKAEEPTLADTNYDLIEPSSEYGSDEQVDYSNAKEAADGTPAFTVDALLTGLSDDAPKTLGTNLPALLGHNGSNKQVDYLFQDESKKRGERGLGEQLCYNTGTFYGLGLMIGGVWGVSEGLRAQNANTFKLRLNAILNGCTRRGPLIGNSAGVATLFFTTMSFGIGKLRGQEHSSEMLNDVLGAGVAGALFKSTAGIKSALTTGAVFAGAAAVVCASMSLYRQRQEEAKYGKSVMHT